MNLRLSARQYIVVVPVLILSVLVGVLAQTAPSPVIRGLPDFTELVEQVGPSVVNIRTTEKVKIQNPFGRGGTGEDDEEEGASPFSGMDPRMLEFFRRFGIPTPNAPNQPNNPNTPKSAPREIERPRGVGSGFILSADGFIMTNAHVVEGATDVFVTLTDKREFKARIVGSDKRTDVAVVKIEAAKLPFVKLGDVARLKVGEWVMAIGSPFGLDNTVTAGIVSAKARDTGEFLPFIQTDVAINPGNSGGPLINMRGEVVGINSQIVNAGSGGYAGVSLAIPIDEATRVADQLRTAGRVARGRIGVEAGSVSKELAESLGLTKVQSAQTPGNLTPGALVARLVDDAPAAKAGVALGDIILKFDGKPIDKSSDLPRAVGGTKPDTKTTITVYRRGKVLDLPITVAELEPEVKKAVRAGRSERAQTPPVPAPAPAHATAAKLGITLLDMTDAQKSELKLSGGALVESTTGAAANSGLRSGDVIVAIANLEVTSAKDAEAVLSRLDKNKPIALQIRRGARGDFVLIKP